MSSQDEFNSKSIGTILKEAREQKELSLKDIQKITKLRIKYLQAIEEENFSVFPGDIYAKGSIRNYAEEVGIDFQLLWGKYEQLYTSDEIDDEDGKETSQNPPFATDSEPIAPLPKINWGRIIALILSAVIIVVSGYLVVNFLLALDFDDEEDSEPYEEQIEQEKSQDTKEGEDEQEEEFSEEEDIEEEQIEINEVEDLVYQIYGAEEVELTLTISDADCWIRVTIDEQRVTPDEGETLQPGSSNIFSLEDEGYFELGYATAAELKANGELVHASDTEGREVVTVIIADE